MNNTPFERGKRVKEMGANLSELVVGQRHFMACHNSLLCATLERVRSFGKNKASTTRTKPERGCDALDKDKACFHKLS